MLYPADPPTFYSRADVLEAGETIASLSTDPCGELLVAVSSTRLHLWSAGPQVAHLLSRDLPGTKTEEEDVGQFVLWGPSAAPTTVVVATMQRLLFFSVNVVIDTQRFLRLQHTKDDEPYLFCLQQSPDVSFLRHVAVDSGCIAGLAPAGPQAFFVWTISGTLYVVGWQSQRILHRWNTADLNQPAHDLGVPSASAAPSPSTAKSASDTAQGQTTQPVVAERAPCPPSVSLAGSAYKGPGTVVRRRPTVTASASYHNDPTADLGDSQQDAQTMRTSPSCSGTHHDGRLSGIIVDAAFSASLRLATLVLSSGQIVLAAPSCGSRFEEAAPKSVHFSGAVVEMAAGALPTRVRLNGRHSLAAITTQDGRVACHTLLANTTPPRLGSAPLWKGLWCVEEERSLCGAVAHMEWDSSEEMLCVGYAQFKMLVLDFSGVCTLNTAVPALFRTARAGQVMDTDVDDAMDREVSNATSGSGASPAARTQPSLGGCTAFAWQSSGPNLFVIPGGAQENAALAVYPMCRVITPPELGDPSASTNMAAVLLLGTHTLVLPTDTVTERYHVPNAAMGDNFPLCYGAISTDGAQVACAGKGGGVILFHRDTRRWHGLQCALPEDSFRCVADPVWLLDRVLVVATRNHATRRHAIVAFAGSLVGGSASSEPLLTMPMKDGQQLAALSASARPASSGGFVVAYTRQQHVYVYRYQVFADDAARPTQLDVTLTLIRHIELTGRLRWPLAIQPVASAVRAPSYSGADRSPGKKVTAPHLLFHCRHTHSLVWCHSQTKKPVGYEPRSAGARPGEPPVPAVVKEDDMWSITPFCTRSGALAVVRAAWFDCSTPMDGLTLLSAESEGLFLYHLASMKVGSPPEVRRSLVALSTELDSVAVAPAPWMARMLCLPAGSPQIQGYLRHFSHQLPDHAQPPPLPLLEELCCRLVPYGHRMLSTLLASTLPNADAGDAAAVTAPGEQTTTASVAPKAPQNLVFAWETRLFYWLEKLRRASQFVPTVDYFLRSVMEEHPPAGLRGVSRRSALRASIRLLRHFPEFHSVTIGCLRKLDISRWHTLLDLIGDPDDLYVECVTTNQLTVAAHLVRVMLMSSFRPRERAVAAAGAGTAGGNKVEGLPRESSMAAAEDASMPGADEESNGDGDASIRQKAAAALCELETPKGMEKSVARAVELFALLVAAGEYTQAYELLRFVALMCHDVSLPVMEAPAEGDGVVRERELFKRVLREKTHHGSCAPVLLNVADAPAFAFDGEEIAPVASGASDRANSHIDHDEERQRREGLRLLFERHTGVCHALDKEASRLLAEGRLRHLVQLLSTFSLSLSHFINQKLGDCTDVSGSTPSLTALVTALHAEFGLPLAPRALPALDAAVVDQAQAACASEFVLALLDEADLMTAMSLWSLPQFVIFSSPRILLALLALSHVFAGHTVYALALNVLLMAKADVMTLVVPRPRSSPQLASDDVQLLAMLADLPRTAPLRCYLTFVESVVHSIPPNLLKSNA